MPCGAVRSTGRSAALFPAVSGRRSEQQNACDRTIDGHRKAHDDMDPPQSQKEPSEVAKDSALFQLKSPSSLMHGETTARSGAETETC